MLLDLLDEVRLGCAMTQETLADEVGWKQTDVSKVLRGARRLDVLELRVWIRAFGLPLEEFVRELDDRLATAEKLEKQTRGARRRKEATKI